MNVYVVMANYRYTYEISDGHDQLIAVFSNRKDAEACAIEEEQMANKSEWVDYYKCRVVEKELE